MFEVQEVYQYILDNLSHYGVVPMYVHNIKSITLVHIFDFPCHRDFHRISYYPDTKLFKYYKLPIDFLHKEEILKVEEVPSSRLIIETNNIVDIKKIFKRSAKLEFPDVFGTIDPDEE